MLKLRYTLIMGFTKESEQAVAKTIAYYDSQDIALTTTEVWSYIFAGGSQMSLQDVERVIQTLEHKHAIVTNNAYVAMAGREKLIDERVKRGMFSEKKFRRVRRVARLLSFLPFVRMVGVCNTLSFYMPRQEGDIDVFIITKANRLYLARVFITFVLHVLRLRRHKLHITDRICLSFYIDEEGLDLERFALPNGDPHLVIWASHIIPIFSIHQTYERFWQVNEKFYRTVLADPRAYQSVDRLRVDDILFSKGVRTFFEIILFPVAPLFEAMTRKNQYERMRESQNRHLRLVATGVVLDRHTMKFHEEDRREFYKTRMAERLSVIERSV